MPSYKEQLPWPSSELSIPNLTTMSFNTFLATLTNLIGCLGTILVQSSSIFTSTLTPMVGVGLVEVETVYPLFLGSNIGTTFTAMLAALTQLKKNTIQGALVHLFYNIIGILIFYPIPILRYPIMYLQY